MKDGGRLSLEDASQRTSGESSATEPRVLIVPMHPGHQYCFCRVGLPTYFLGHWDQFQYWRPKPPNVHNVLAEFGQEQLRFGSEQYAALLDGGCSLRLEQDVDLAWLIFGWQYKLFRERALPKAYHATFSGEIPESVWAEMLERDDFRVAAYYPNTAEWVQRRFGVRIPYIPIGLDPREYAGHRGDDAVLLTVIHSWSKRGWHYELFQEATRGLPTLHVDHLNPEQPPYRYEDLLEAYRSSRVYVHDGQEEYTIALLEAMMSGLPIVTCEIPGIEGYVRHGINGFVGRDAREIREYCRMLLHDDDLASSMGAAGRSLAMANYALDRWQRDWRALIGDLLQRELRPAEESNARGVAKDGAKGGLTERLRRRLRKKLAEVKKEDPNIYPLF